MKEYVSDSETILTEPMIPSYSNFCGKFTVVDTTMDAWRMYVLNMQMPIV
jgi:hypothetical protein